MPRSGAEIIEQAERLADFFEEAVPRPGEIRNADSLRDVRKAFLRRAGVELELTSAVEQAREDGQSWSAIGAMLGTSGEAARQRYGRSQDRR